MNVIKVVAENTEPRGYEVATDGIRFRIGVVKGKDQYWLKEGDFQFSGAKANSIILWSGSIQADLIVVWAYDVDFATTRIRVVYDGGGEAKALKGDMNDQWQKLEFKQEAAWLPIILVGGLVAGIVGVASKFSRVGRKR